MNRTRKALGLAIVLVGCWAGQARADQLLLGRRLVIRQSTYGSKLVLVVRDLSLIAPTPGGPADPTLTGASFTVVNPGTTESVTFPLPPGDWSTNSSGTRFKFLNRLAPGGSSPVKVATITNGASRDARTPRGLLAAWGPRYSATHVRGGFGLKLHGDLGGDELLFTPRGLLAAWGPRYSVMHARGGFA